MNNLHLISRNHLPFCCLLIISYASFAQDASVLQYQESEAEIAMKEENYRLAAWWYEKVLQIKLAEYERGSQCNFCAFKEIVQSMDHLMSAYKQADSLDRHLQVAKDLSAFAWKGIELFSDESAPYLEYGLAQITVAETLQALGQYEEGLAVCDQLINYFESDRYLPAMSVAKQMVPFSHSRAGEILKDMGDLEASVERHQQSIAGWENALKEIQHTMMHEEIGEQAKICVQRFEALKDTTNLLKYAAISLRHYEILTEMKPESEAYIRETEKVVNTLASYQSALGNYSEAIELYTRNLRLNTASFEQNGHVSHLTQMTALNLKISKCYQSAGNQVKSAEHALQRIEYLQQLQTIDVETDYAYTISNEWYNLAFKYKHQYMYGPSMEAIDASIEWGNKAIANDPANTRKKEWQWVQEFFRYQLALDTDDLQTAENALDRLEQILTALEPVEPGEQYVEHLKEVGISRSLLKYPDLIALEKEVEAMEEGKPKFARQMDLVSTLTKRKKKDNDLTFAFVKHTNILAWTGLMSGEYKASGKALKKAMRIKPVDPYLITNYAPCLLFMGKYKKAEKIYYRHYADAFRPGEKIIQGFMNDFEKFEEEDVVPDAHRTKLEEIKNTLLELPLD